jgi:hypothetical protein
MAGDWIKFEHATSDKPEVFRMAEILGIDPDAVTGKLIRFWAWCDQQTVDGSSLGISDSVIDRVTHQPGFSAALREVSWLQARSGSLAIPNFDRHNGQTAKARAVENRKKANQRERGKCPENVPIAPGQNEGQKPGPEKRREEKSNTETIPPPNPPPPATAEDCKDPRHYAVTSRWGTLYAGAFGCDYAFDGRDAMALKRLLSRCKDDAEALLTVAVQAWERSKQDRFAKQCKEAATLHGLCTRYNDIRAELKTPLQGQFGTVIKDNDGSVRTRKF